MNEKLFTKCRSYRERWQVQLESVPEEQSWEGKMKDIPYASAVGSFMYSLVCTRHDISFVVGMLGRYQSNPGLYH